MAASKSKNDQFSNIAYLSVEESAASTLTFARLEMATALMTEKTAIIIHKAEMVMSLGAAFLNANGIYVAAALTLSDRLTTLTDLSQPEILFFAEETRTDYLDNALAAQRQINIMSAPIIRDFSNLPGGGILVPADRLYIGVEGNNAGQKMSVSCRIYYTVMTLAVDQYWELIEARRIMTT